jgi:hypothetical protein
MTTVPDNVPVLMVIRWTGPNALADKFEAIGARVILAGCGHMAWLSPQGDQQLRERPDATTQCTECIDPRRLRTMRMVPGAYEVAASALSSEELGQALLMMAMLGLKEEE